MDTELKHERAPSRAAYYLALALYLPYLLAFLSMRPPRDWTALPVAPGWLVWFVFEPGRNRLLALLSAGSVTACLYFGLLWLSYRGTAMRAVAILIALALSVPSALFLAAFATISGR